jgi:hypothetical protein
VRRRRSGQTRAFWIRVKALSVANPAMGVKPTLAIASLAVSLVVSACSANPCSMRHVVQVTDDQSPKYAAMRAKMLPLGMNGIGKDVELDDGHVYVANVAYNIAADGKMIGNMPPETADELELCALTATDGSKHYALHFKGQRYAAELVR